MFRECYKLKVHPNCCSLSNKQPKVDYVRIGEFDLHFKTDSQGEESRIVFESHVQDIPVENISPHQNFSRLAPVNDIALIRLLTPINFEYRNAVPICLPVTQELRNVSLAGTIGMIARWGLTEEDTNFKVLLKSNVSIKTDDECKKITYNNEPADGTVRALKEISADENKEDGCIGDGGSPLMVQGIYQGVDRYIQYGIVVRGPIQCGSQPAVYTDVTKYMGWILDNLKE